MAGGRAVVFRQQVHLEVGDQRSRAQEVVPHQTVEVERRRGPDVGLDVGHLRQAAHGERELSRHRRGVLERRPLRHVDDHLQLALVVVRQHLHRGDAQRKERHGGEEQHGDAAEQREAARTTVEEGPEETLIEPMEAVFLHRLEGEGVGQLVGLGELPFGELRGVLLEQAIGEPGGDHEGDDQREQHGGRGVDRNRPHVGAHEPGDEGERQQRADDREGGEDRRIADFVGGVNRRVPRIRPAQLIVAMNVLDDDDGVVDQDADREDEREESDAIERVAEEVGGGERQGECDRDRDSDHHRLAPPEGCRHEQDDRDRGEGEVLHELARLLVGRGTVVPRLGDLDVAGEDRTAQAGHQGVELGDQLHRVGAGLLGDRQGHCGRIEPGRQALRGAGRPPVIQTYCAGSSAPSVTVATSRR